MNKSRDKSLWKGFLCPIMTYCTQCREIRERWGSETRREKRETSTLNHSLGVLLLWSLFFLFSSVERSVFRGTREEERGCERQRGRIGIRICTLTKSRPTTMQPELSVSSLQHLSVSSHPKPTTGRLLSTLYSLSSLCFISSNLSKSETTTNPSLLPAEYILFAAKFDKHTKPCEVRKSQKHLFIVLN